MTCLLYLRDPPNKFLILFTEMNKIHPILKFTMTHTSNFNENIEESCNCEMKYSIAFLDTSCSIENRKIEIDLYCKETDRNQYLMPESCHPKTTTKNIQFSLALRIVRICTKPNQRDVRLNDLKTLLLQRKYSEYLVDNCIEKAKNIPREKAIKKRKI